MAVADVPLSDALIQMKRPEARHYSTAFTLGIVRGAAIYVLLFGASFVLSWVYDDARLQPVLAVIALAPALRSIVSPRMAVYARRVSFAPEALTDIGSKLVSFGAAAAVAVSTESYWAIVIGQVVAPLIYVALSYVLAPIRPTLTLQCWRELVGFSGWMSLQRLLNVLNFYIDRFIIAGRIGQAALGIYVVASDWAALATQTLQAPLSKVLFARLALDAHDPRQIKTTYLRAQAGAGAILLPVGIGMALIAPFLIPPVLGPAWEPAVVIIVVLSPLFAIQSLTAPAQAVAMACGATRALFWRDVLNFAVRVPLVIVGVILFGIFGVLAARVIAGLNITAMNLVLVKRLIQVPILAQLTSMWRSIVAAIFMTGVVLACQYWLVRASSIGDLGIASVTVAVGVTAYVSAHYLAWILSGRPDGPEAMALRAIGGNGKKRWGYSS